MGSRQVQFTIDDVARGERIVTDLLHDRLVACAQTIGPITSRYWWNGAVERAESGCSCARRRPNASTR